MCNITRISSLRTLLNMYNFVRFSAENQEDRAICVVDGKTYKEGQHFKVASDPELTCVCQAGYKGEES